MRRVLLFAWLTAGCSAGAPEAAAALPTREAVAIKVPGASPAASGTSAQALLGAQANFYALTRQISTGINNGAATFFDLVEKLVATPPTAQDATNSYWGPLTDPLSPMTAVLGVKRVDAQDY